LLADLAAAMDEAMIATGMVKASPPSPPTGSASDTDALMARLKSLEAQLRALNSRKPL
jgi:hypothetical protein